MDSYNSLNPLKFYRILEDVRKPEVNLKCLSFSSTCFPGYSSQWILVTILAQGMVIAVKGCLLMSASRSFYASRLGEIM